MYLRNLVPIQILTDSFWILYQNQTVISSYSLVPSPIFSLSKRSIHITAKEIMIDAVPYSTPSLSASPRQNASHGFTPMFAWITRYTATPKSISPSVAVTEFFKIPSLVSFIRSSARSHYMHRSYYTTWFADLHQKLAFYLLYCCNSVVLFFYSLSEDFIFQF